MSEVNTVEKLHEFLGQLMEKEGLAKEPVLFDTEGRTFNYHMAAVGRAYFNKEPYAHIQLCEERPLDNSDERLRRIETMIGSGKLDPVVASEMIWLVQGLKKSSQLVGVSADILEQFKPYLKALREVRDASHVVFTRWVNKKSGFGLFMKNLEDAIKASTELDKKFEQLEQRLK